MSLHPLLVMAAEGTLPQWAEVGGPRRAHMARVAELMGAWAGAWELPEEEIREWRALGMLHDVLRDADPARLREELGPEWHGLPDPLLHAPAGAERLRVAGVEDPAFLLAVRYHPLGHPEMGRIGNALYCADFLEPGRNFLPEWREGLRERIVSDFDGVLREVARSRIERLEGGPTAIRPETRAFWDRITQGVRT